MEQLVQHAIHGKKNAMKDLLLRHRNLIESVVARFLWDRFAWEDVIQNIFMKVMSAINEFSGKCQVSTWIYRIAVNECIEANRRNARWKQRIDSRQEFGDITLHGTVFRVVVTELETEITVLEGEVEVVHRNHPDSPQFLLAGGTDG